MENLYLDYAVSTTQLETKPSKTEAGNILSSIDFQQKKGTIYDLERDIRSGSVSVCGHYDRDQQFKWKGNMTEAWQYSNVVVVDIDNGSCKFDELMERMTFTPTLVATSGSYVEGKDEEHSLYKYHCYYFFTDKIKTIQEYQKLYDHLDYQLNQDGVYDYNKVDFRTGEVCKKDSCGKYVAHLFYGNVNAKTALNTNKVYSLNMFDCLDVTVPEYTPQHRNKVKAIKKWDGFLDKKLEKELLTNRLVDFVKKHSLVEFVGLSKEQIPVKMGEDESRANKWGIIPREFQDLTRLFYNYAKPNHLQFHEIGSGRYYKLFVIAHVYRSWDSYTPEQVAVLLAHWCVHMFDLRMSVEDARDKFNGSYIYDLVKSVFKKDPMTLREYYKKKGLGVAISKTYCTIYNMSPQAVYGQWVSAQTDEKIADVFDCNSTDTENAQVAKVSPGRIATFRMKHNLPRVSKGERTRGVILQLIKEGIAKKDIAEKLGMSPNTVKQYIRDISNHKYNMNKNYDIVVNNLYMYYPKMKDRKTPPEQEGKKTESTDYWQERYDQNESIRTNETRLRQLGFNVSKSTIARWLKKQKENKTESDENSNR